MNPELRNERLFAFAAPYTWNNILRIMRKMDPLRPLPDLFPDVGKDLSTLRTKWGANLLEPWGMKDWVGLEQTVVSTIKSLDTEVETRRAPRSLRSHVMRTVDGYRPRLILPLTSSFVDQAATC